MKQVIINKALKTTERPQKLNYPELERINQSENYKDAKRVKYSIHKNSDMNVCYLYQ